MSDTKEKILLTALRLFACEGYEAVSVSAIAGELGMTKGALYKHYKNKRDIFDSIVERMYQIDADRAKKHEVPEETFDKGPSAYRNTSVDRIKSFTREQFCFWARDEFARDFRKMLTLEQYRNAEMADLYQKCLAGGPVSYMEDLFREMIGQGLWKKSCPKQLAIEFYAPFYLLMSILDAPLEVLREQSSDEAPAKHRSRAGTKSSSDFTEEATNLLMNQIEKFIAKNAVK